MSSGGMGGGMGGMGRGMQRGYGPQPMRGPQPMGGNYSAGGNQGPQYEPINTRLPPEPMTGGLSPMSQFGNPNPTQASSTPTGGPTPFNQFSNPQDRFAGFQNLDQRAVDADPDGFRQHLAAAQAAGYTGAPPGAAPSGPASGMSGGYGRNGPIPPTETGGNTPINFNNSFRPPQPQPTYQSPPTAPTPSPMYQGPQPTHQPPPTAPTPSPMEGGSGGGNYSAGGNQAGGVMGADGQTYADRNSSPRAPVSAPWSPWGSGANQQFGMYGQPGSGGFSAQVENGINYINNGNGQRTMYQAQGLNQGGGNMELNNFVNYMNRYVGGARPPSSAPPSSAPPPSAPPPTAPPQAGSPWANTYGGLAGLNRGAGPQFDPRRVMQNGPGVPPPQQQPAFAPWGRNPFQRY